MKKAQEGVPALVCSTYGEKDNRKFCKKLRGIRDKLLPRLVDPSEANAQAGMQGKIVLQPDSCTNSTAINLSLAVGPAKVPASGEASSSKEAGGKTSPLLADRNAQAVVRYELILTSKTRKADYRNGLDSIFEAGTTHDTAALKAKTPDEFAIGKEPKLVLAHLRDVSVTAYAANAIVHGRCKLFTNHVIEEAATKVRRGGERRREERRGEERRGEERTRLT